MQALILSAGEGTRLRPLTQNMPKVMVPIMGKPLLQHLIELCKKHLITDILINLYYKPESVIEYFGDGRKFGVSITYTREDLSSSYHGPLLLGSAGALHNMKNLIKDTVVVLYGDVYSTLDLPSLIQFHKKKKSDFTVVVHESTHPHDSDLVDIDKKGKITHWIKTPHNRSFGVNSAGTYVLHKRVLHYLPPEVPSDFAHDFIPLLLRKHVPLFGYKTDDFLMDMGTMNRYNKLIAILHK